MKGQGAVIYEDPEWSDKQIKPLPLLATAFMKEQYRWLDRTNLIPTPKWWCAISVR